MTIKAWRDIAIPHQDVLKGTFKQSEFAADLTQVHSGDASAEYQDPIMFFQRTFITEGMSLLLDSVIKRLSGNGGDPVIQLQTAFGGGKTHTMLAVYHIAKGDVPPSELQGIPPIIDRAGLTSLPKARVIVLDGNLFSPGNPRSRNGLSVNTLWGELAWQLGGANAYEQVRQADLSGTSPGKEDLIKLLRDYAPCVILMDELVAYIRQFEPGKSYTGGSYDSNISFIHALTEALKAVPNALMLVSLPESNREAGSTRGVDLLKTLEHYFARIQALWKPVATEEAFEIVRRRLFEPITDEAAVQESCRVFADFYINNKNDFPNETQEANYYERLKQSYPIHPEIFDRLYEDWSSLDNFQRTRGVLKLMAKVIHKLWSDDNQDALIMPGNLPLYDADVRNETIYYLPPGWDPVLERDIDGSRSEPTNIERQEARFGQVQACKKMARTIFFGSAPHAVALHSDRSSRGIEYKRILLGSVQPNQVIGIFKDAMNRLVDRLHYLSNADNKLFWFDTRPNLRREMEDRKRRFSDIDDVVPVIKDELQRLISNGCFEGVHVFTRSDDIPDDYSLRLVILPPDAYFMRSGSNFATMGTSNSEGAKKILTSRGEQNRLRQNRMIFLAADGDVVVRLKDHVLTLLAWESIFKDIQNLKLNLDQYQARQAKTEFEDKKRSLARIVKESYKWILVPEQDKFPGDRFEPFTINPSVPNIVEEIERILRENEHLITSWAPIHLHNLLKKWYWKNGVKEVKAKDVWHNTCCYLYLPRLQNEKCFQDAVVAGVESRDFFAFAYGKEANSYVGFSFAQAQIPVYDSALLLIEPIYAAEYQASMISFKPAPKGVETSWVSSEDIAVDGDIASKPVAPTFSKPKQRFYGRLELNPNRSKADFATIVDEIVMHLISNPAVDVKIKIEIEAKNQEGFDEAIQRTIKENSNTLRFDLSEFE